ncbi:MAG: hypothetical protein HY518_02690 [Candidatus Aenigmarchaeota archaeon]|nr:hypothetical protein [Candidatus Aenigmarchaeota archaeon]
MKGLLRSLAAGAYISLAALGGAVAGPANTLVCEKTTGSGYYYPGTERCEYRKEGTDSFRLVGLPGNNYDTGFSQGLFGYSRTIGDLSIGANVEMAEKNKAIFGAGPALSYKGEDVSASGSYLFNGISRGHMMLETPRGDLGFGTEEGKGPAYFAGSNMGDFYLSLGRKTAGKIAANFFAEAQAGWNLGVFSYAVYDPDASGGDKRVDVLALLDVSDSGRTRDWTGLNSFVNYLNIMPHGLVDTLDLPSPLGEDFAYGNMPVEIRFRRDAEGSKSLAIMQGRKSDPHRWGIFGLGLGLDFYDGKDNDGNDTRNARLALEAAYSKKFKLPSGETIGILLEGRYRPASEGTPMGSETSGALVVRTEF